jgi:hypothetical protein
MNLFEQQPDFYFDLCKTLRDRLPIPMGGAEICSQITLSLKILDPKITQRFFPISEMLGNWLVEKYQEWIRDPLFLLKSKEDLHLAVKYAGDWVKNYPDISSVQNAYQYLISRCQKQ